MYVFLLFVKDMVNNKAIKGQLYVPEYKHGQLNELHSYISKETREAKRQRLARVVL